ncbi:MAG: LD-carboxypeptidase [Burkholderiaceae bacterium]
MSTMTLFTPAGVLLKSAPLKLAARRLKAMGFDVTIDEAALAKHQRFGGDDDTRLAAVHRIAEAAPSIAMASRGGYGLTRLLDRLDWKKLGRSADRGTRWVGYSDMTALQMGMLAHTGSPTWCGPLAADDFGREVLDEVTPACFEEAMSGELEAIGFRTEAGFDGLQAKGVLWGGNLTVLTALLGTPHWPQVKGGVLFVEDVNEHPYRVERMLLQLHQAGVLARQKAVVLGAISDWRPSPMDRGYDLKAAVAHVRSVTRTPILTGLPFGHVDTKVTMPFGRAVTLLVEGRDALIGW